MLAWETGVTTTSVRYFTSTRFSPPALLRRAGYVDEAFVGGEWRPTRAVVDWLFGHDDHVREIPEDEAQAFAPAAF